MAHTFSEESRKFYKVNPGSVVVFVPERFHNKYENKYHTLEIQVGNLLQNLDCLKLVS